MPYNIVLVSAIQQHVSHRYTYVPSLLNLPTEISSTPKCHIFVFFFTNCLNQEAVEVHMLQSIDMYFPSLLISVLTCPLLLVLLLSLSPLLHLSYALFLLTFYLKKHSCLSLRILYNPDFCKCIPIA